MWSVVTLEESMCFDQYLTLAQKGALEKWTEINKNRIFTGTTPEIISGNFSRINAIREIDPKKADELELAMFELCGVEAKALVTN